MYGLLATVSLAPCWALKPGEHIEMEQRADRFGVAKIFFDNQSLKIVLKTAAVNGHRQDLIIMSESPNWHVCIVNDQLKLKYNESVYGIADENQLTYGHLPPTILKPCVESDTSFMGQPAKLLVGQPKNPNVNKGETFLPGSTDSQTPAVKIQRLEYTVLQERVPPGLSHVIEAFFNVPMEDRYPLNFVQVTSRGSDKLMTTISVCKKPGTVVLPAEPNYKEAENLVQVKYGMQQDNIKDIGLQLLGGGSR
jgi:hypothetical protein